MEVLILFIGVIAIMSLSATIVEGIGGSNWRVPWTLWVAITLATPLLVGATMAEADDTRGDADRIGRWATETEAQVAAMVEAVLPEAEVHGQASSGVDHGSILQVSVHHYGRGWWHIEAPTAMDQEARWEEIAAWWRFTHPDQRLSCEDTEPWPWPNGVFESPEGNSTWIKVRGRQLIEITWRTIRLADTPWWWHATWIGYVVMILAAVALTITAKRAGRRPIDRGGKKPTGPLPE